MSTRARGAAGVEWFGHEDDHFNTTEVLHNTVGGGRVSDFPEKALRNTCMAPNRH